MYSSFQCVCPCIVLDMECIDGEVNRMLVNTTTANNHEYPSRLPVNACINQPLSELCDNSPVSNEHWVLYISGCNITLHSITSGLRQVISLKKCQTIYKCWLVFDNTSICLSLSTDDNAQPAKRLYLDVFHVQRGEWTRPKYGRQSVFFTFHRVGTISSSVALRGINDDVKGRIAEFFIGNGRTLWRLTLLLDSLSSGPELKTHRPCKNNYQVIQVSKAGTDNVVVFCDKQIILTNLKLRESLDITPPELLNELLNNTYLNSARSFFSKSGKTAFISVKSQVNTINCLIFLDIQNSSSNCKMVPSDATVTDGVFINDKQFFCLLNYTSAIVINTTGIPFYGATITVNICPVGNCFLHQTDKLLYIYDQQITTVLDKQTYESVTIQNTSIYEVLSRVEKAYHNCNKQIPVVTSASPIITVDPPIPTSGSDPQTLTILTTRIGDSNMTLPSTRTSVIKSSILSTASDTIYITATPIIQSSQMTTGNVQESPLPSGSMVTKESEEIPVLIIMVVALSSLLLASMTLIIYFCCKRKDHHSSNGREQIMARLKTHELPWQPPLVCLSTGYIMQASQRNHHIHS